MTAKRRGRGAPIAKGGRETSRSRRFELKDTYSRVKEGLDEPGPIRLYIRRVDEQGQHIKGNVTRTLTLKHATVEAVFDAIRDALL
jgi:hypothetical protein